MQQSKLILTLFLMFFSWMSLSTPLNAASQNDPIALLEYVANNMISGLKENKATLKTKPQVVYQLAYKYVVPYADLDGMARQVLPAHIWNSATPEQRAQFKKEFTTTLIRTYASALTSYEDQVIKFYPIRGGIQGLNSVEVNSEIDSSHNEPIQVTYRVTRVGGSWRLNDLSVEGVSMLESFRSQFEDILSQGNMSELLRRMAEHNNRRR